MNDLISREAACQQMDNLFEEDLEAYGTPIPECFDADRAIVALMGLPSAEPEIIYCKDCVKHGKRFDEYPASEACPLTVWRVAQGHEYDYQFCVYAERRTDE